MDHRPTFEELCELEPLLSDFDAEARAEHDDGRRSFYCSNFVWLPMYTRLRGVLGAYRARPGEAREGPLYASESFETAYEHLSRLLPPCRDCGCTAFEPIREEQTRARTHA